MSSTKMLKNMIKLALILTCLAALCLSNPLGSISDTHNDELIRKARAINIGNNQTIHGNISSSLFDDDVNIGMGATPGHNANHPSNQNFDLNSEQTTKAKGAGDSIHNFSKRIYFIAFGVFYLILNYL